VGNLPAVEHLVDVPVVGVDELDAVVPWRESFAGACERIQVAVETDDARGARFEQRARVPAEADGAVDEEPALLGPKMMQDLGGHDRNVRHQIPNSDSAFASSSVKGSRWSLACRRSWFQVSR
jgi:hypothetical protein